MAALVKNLRRAAEIVAVICFTAMFAGFILQVVMRYGLNSPLDWTQELCIVLYLFGVFWTAAFLLKERDHVAFTVIYDHAPVRARRVMAAIGAIAIGVAFAADLPAAWDYIAYMGRQTTPVMRLRFDLVFGIFLIFMVAVVWRSGLTLRHLLGANWRAHVASVADIQEEEGK
ncbi:MAG: TRAP transporter small permease subunit [Siculibacillus sp.]|nr:TRAP transporter small permease subunit [Siculibacillus sp.]